MQTDEEKSTNKRQSRSSNIVARDGSRIMRDGEIRIAIKHFNKIAQERYYIKTLLMKYSKARFKNENAFIAMYHFRDSRSGECSILWPTSSVPKTQNVIGEILNIDEMKVMELHVGLAHNENCSFNFTQQQIKLLQVRSKLALAEIYFDEVIICF